MEIVQQLLNWARELSPIPKAFVSVLIASLAGLLIWVLWQKPKIEMPEVGKVAIPDAANVNKGNLPTDLPNVSSSNQSGGVTANNYYAALPVDNVNNKSDRAGDTYNVSNTGSGTAIGRVENLNMGKQPFVMTEQVMSDVLARIDKSKPVTMYAIGPSRTATEQLTNYLVAQGVEVAAFNSIGIWSVAGIDVPQVPIIVGEPAPTGGRVVGSTPIVVDVTK